jgi:hypothetical protein
MFQAADFEKNLSPFSLSTSLTAFDARPPISIVGIARSQGGVKLSTGGNGKQFPEPASASRTRMKVSRSG